MIKLPGLYFLTIVLLSLILSSCVNNKAPSITVSEGDDFSLSLPPEMEEYINRNDVSCMSGLVVTLNNCDYEYTTQGNIDVYNWTGEKISATVEMMNGLQKEQPYYLIVLSAGIPIEFSVEETNYTSYPFELTDHKKIEIEFTPKVFKDCPRLDFLLCCDDDIDIYFETTFTILLSSELLTLLDISPTQTIEKSTSVSEALTGNSYNSWLINSDADYIFEAASGSAGLYRIAFIINDTPDTVIIELTPETYLDYDSNDNQMIHSLFQFDHDKDIETFFTICTPLSISDISMQCRTSSITHLSHEQ